MEFQEFDIEFLSQKLAENPHSPLFARLADLYVDKEQAEEAMKLLKEGITRYPDYYAGYIVLGKAHLAFKEYSRAQSAFEKALELSPFNQTAAKLLISVPNKPDESTRTTDENYFLPSKDVGASTEAATAETTEEQSFSPEPVQEFAEQASYETPVGEEFGIAAQPEETTAVTTEQTYINESLFDTVAEEIETTESTESSFPSHDEYFAQNQSRINTQTPISLDEYLSSDQSAMNSVVTEENRTHVFTNDSYAPSTTEVKPAAHVDPEVVFASPEQEQLFAEMNAMNEESPPEVSTSSTDIDSLAEKLQSAEKIIPQENYQPQNPVPQETQDDQSYETDAVTPTLAEIYASQGEYRAAIQAYEILMFSQPAKGGEFQQRIRELQQKQMEKDGLI